MLGGKNKSQPLGYTIVEVMIVLAVSSVVFLAATNFIGGRQSRTAFTQGVNEMASQVQNVIEQVKDGHYSDISLSCTFNPGPPADTNASAGGVGAEQGENAPCVFIGKVIYFNQDSPSYRVLSMAGGRIIPTSNDTAQALLQADPVSITDLAINRNIPQSLTVYNVTSTEAGHPPYSYRQHAGGGNWSSNALGFFQSQGDANGGGVNSGPQTLSLIQTWGHTDAHGQYSLNNSIHELQSSSICVTDGERYGEILIGADLSGSSTNALTVTVKMDEKTPC